MRRVTCTEHCALSYRRRATCIGPLRTATCAEHHCADNFADTHCNLRRATCARHLRRALAKSNLQRISQNRICAGQFAKSDMRRALSKINVQTCAEQLSRRTSSQTAPRQQLVRGNSRRALQKSHLKRSTCAEKLQGATVQSSFCIATCREHLAARRAQSTCKGCACTEPSLQIRLPSTWNSHFYTGACNHRCWRAGGLTKHGGNTLAKSRRPLASLVLWRRNPYLIGARGSRPTFPDRWEGRELEGGGGVGMRNLSQLGTEQAVVCPGF